MYLDAGREMLPPAFLAPLSPTITKPIYVNLAPWAKAQAGTHSCFCRHDNCYWHKGDLFDVREYEENNVNEIFMSQNIIDDNLPTSDQSLDKPKDSDVDPMLDNKTLEETSSISTCQRLIQIWAKVATLARITYI